jgi:hypothetical protein
MAVSPNTDAQVDLVHMFMNSTRGFPCPEVTLWTFNTLTHNMFHLSTECYVKRAHMQCIDVAIRKIASVQDSCLETDVCSTDTGMDAVDGHQVLRGPLLGIIPVLVALIPQLQLWHLHWLVVSAVLGLTCIHMY